MKKILLLLFAGLLSMITQAQSLPYIATPTLIPQSPTSSDIIKIVIKVTTPNQGIIVDQSTFSVTQSPQEINIRGCYWQGMLTATQDYVDTLVIGQLQPGTYTIKHKAFLSSTQQHCSAIDSNMVVVTTLTVGTVTALKELGKNIGVSVFPVPANEVLHLINTSAYTQASIYACNGNLISERELENTSELITSDLAPGLYFIRFSNTEKTACIKFTKE